MTYCCLASRSLLTKIMRFNELLFMFLGHYFLDLSSEKLTDIELHYKQAKHEKKILKVTQMPLGLQDSTLTFSFLRKHM